MEKLSLQVWGIIYPTLVFQVEKQISAKIDNQLYALYLEDTTVRLSLFAAKSQLMDQLNEPQ